ncbi:hypothetical protein ACK6D9_11435 [Hoeflea sp. Naph1]|uniref:hypothetical protein n=1 Tax=Hoeflea sp. Naph1 TaxID=3388653 RepID=UPI0039901FCD
MIRFKAKTDEKPTPPAKPTAKAKPVEKAKAKAKSTEDKDLLDLTPDQPASED